jgi:hypothetical protein
LPFIPRKPPEGTNPPDGRRRSSGPAP